MTDVPKLKIPTSEVRKSRHVETVILELTAKQKKELMAARVDVIFSVHFLSRLFKGTKRMETQMRQPARSIRDGLEQHAVKTVKEALKLKYEQLDAVSRFGASAMGLYLDVLTAFGLPTPSIPNVSLLRQDFGPEADELAEKLGIK